MNKTKVSILYLFILLCLSQVVVAQNVFNVEFNSETSFRKFVVTKMSDHDGDYFREKPPYSASATFNITLDLSGNILAIAFVEKSEDKRFNDVFKELLMTTSGLWKITNPKEGTSTVNIIIPILQKTPPDKVKLERPELIKQFQDYHKTLRVGEIPHCEQGSCVIFDELVNVIGPRSKGIK